MGEIQQLVIEFHEKFGAPITSSPNLAPFRETELRHSLMQEELSEYLVATHMDDLIGIADALADLAYVVYGTAIIHGIDLDAVIREVHRSNMTKLGADGTPIYRMDGKVLKGPNYEPPNIARVLEEQR